MPVHTFPLTGPINLLVRIGHGAVASTHVTTSRRPASN